jgi:hypothetical protein
MDSSWEIESLPNTYGERAALPDQAEECSQNTMVHQGDRQWHTKVT